MDLIDELTSLREAKGIPQSDVATACGVDQSAVSLWENRKNAPSGSAKILLQQFIEEARGLPDKQRKAVAA